MPNLHRFGERANFMSTHALNIVAQGAVARGSAFWPKNASEADASYIAQVAQTEFRSKYQALLETAKAGGYLGWILSQPVEVPAAWAQRMTGELLGRAPEASSEAQNEMRFDELEKALRQFAQEALESADATLRAAEASPRG